ncbi:Urb1p Ecym_3393 [Eremothecium cymbalariae DBVPG|uniref:Nucleolar pre-ribosomal-associated protein 1 C-terminal domain-containing protein n=1 Tax=Eremothecium cymbalariae (strain CBS 270.75 / DBVPG 7215 / KCTC 17166 / NRRL Y-17582) TaxID=931890 RepID=G8JRW1_ERECY|nr:Hypothetical protein Ecym_3393 [Eremothecium cymbalariae DBVPG\
MDDHNDDFSKNQKSTWKQKLNINSNFNDALLQQLQRILSNIDLINEGVANNYQPIIEFFEKGFCFQVVQGWSYYAQINNQNMFADCSIKLYKTLEVLDSNSSVQQFGTILIKEILDNYSKVFYRGLSAMRPSVTNPIIKLMKQIILFHNGQHVDDFLTYFDLSITSILKIMTPNKIELKDTSFPRKNTHYSMRANFITFWIQLVKNAHPLLRMSILTENQKIMSNWFKYIIKVDTYELLDATLDVLTEFVLKEKSFKKSTKCKILNEHILSKLHELYYSPNKKLLQKADLFFQAYGVDPQFSVVFPDDKIWLDECIEQKQGGLGVTITVNNREFQLYNKIVYKVLTFFKPWEDELQCNTVLKVLRNVPELVAPYCNFLASHGYHDPKMTSYWFSLTLVLGRIINLPIPPRLYEIQTNKTPNMRLVMENVLPSSISKTCLSKSIQHEVPLIKQMGCQLLIFSLKKFDLIQQLYDKHGWDSGKALLNSAYYKLLPDLTVIVSTLNEVYNKSKENKVLSLSLTKVLNYYASLFPNYFQVTLPSSNIFLDIMGQESFHGCDVVILDNFLQFQELNSSQAKWWHSTKDKHSLFSSLLRMASSKNSIHAISTKISNLVDRLLQYTVFMNTELLLASPVLCLINTLSTVSRVSEMENDSSSETLWKLLDETISRCIKFPYKYVDIAKDYDNVSPFIVALCEQWKHVDRESPNNVAAEWLLLFLRGMVIIGESSTGICRLSTTLEGIEKSLIEVYLNFSAYESCIPLLSEKDYLLSSSSDFSFVDYISLVDISEIANITRYPVNDLDVAGILFRVHTILQADSIQFSKHRFPIILDSLLSRVGNYALINENFKNKFKSRKCFEKLVLSTHFDTNDIKICEKYVYSTHVLLQIYKQLDTEIDEFAQYAFELVKENFSAWHLVGIFKDILNELCTVMSTKQLSYLLEEEVIDDNITIAFILRNLHTNNVSISGELFIKLAHRSEEELNSVLGGFLQKQLVNKLELNLLYEESLKSSSKIHLIQHSLDYSGAIEVLKRYLEGIEDFNILIGLASILQPSDDRIILQFLEKAVALALKNFATVENKMLKDSLNLFCSCHSMLSNEDKNSIIECITSNNELRFTELTVKFITICFPSEKNIIRTWLNKMILFITKNLAENQRLHQDFIQLLSQFKYFALENNIWTLANKNSVNSQLEVLLSREWVKHDDILEYASILILGGISTSIESEKLLQIFINNNLVPVYDRNAAKYSQYLSMVIISNLFSKDVSKNSSTSLQEKLLTVYGGTIRPHDRLILQILERIEATISVSWINHIYSWEFLDSLTTTERELITLPNLIEKKNEGYLVTLDKDVLENSIQNYPKLDYIGLEVEIYSNTSWHKIQEYFKQFELSTKSSNYQVYDALFVLLLVINNDELVRQQLTDDGHINYKFEVKTLLDSKIFQFVIMSLSDSRPEVSNIAFTIVEQMLGSLQGKSQFKGSNIFKILLTKIIYTFTQSSNEQKISLGDVPPIIWYAISRLIDNLTQPRSSLYEKAYRWVLSSPLINVKDVPLLKPIISPQNSEDSENYYRNLQWLLDTLNRGLRSKNDVHLLKSKNLFEWLMNLQNSPYLSMKSRTDINSIMFKAQRIESGGSILITRSAGIAHVEQQKLIAARRVHELISIPTGSWKKNKMEEMTFRQEKLNNQELALGYSVIVGSQKRLKEWCEDDVGSIIKKIRQ